MERRRTSTSVKASEEGGPEELPLMRAGLVGSMSCSLADSQAGKRGEVEGWKDDKGGRSPQESEWQLGRTHR